MLRLVTPSGQPIPSLVRNTTHIPLRAVWAERRDGALRVVRGEHHGKASA